MLGKRELFCLPILLVFGLLLNLVLVAGFSGNRRGGLCRILGRLDILF